MEMLETSFRIHRDEVTRTLIGCPSTAEMQQESLAIAKMTARCALYMATCPENLKIFESP